MLGRADWRAKRARWVTRHNANLPKVVIHHGGVKLATHSREGEAATLRAYQRSHFSRGWSDCAYNFAVGVESGRTWAVRGWNRRPGATRGHNKTSIAVVIIGHTSQQPVSEPCVNAIKDLIAAGIATGHLAADVKIYGHSDLAATQCPGRSARTALTRMMPTDTSTADELTQLLDDVGYSIAASPLRRRSRGLEVTTVQHLLSNIGHDPGRIDGIYGWRTTRAVKLFQRTTTALAVDGITGAHTWRALRKART